MDAKGAKRSVKMWTINSNSTYISYAPDDFFELNLYEKKA